MLKDRESRLARAHTALTGLWIGDCFGVMYFFQMAETIIERRFLLAGEWEYTDDTLMALSIYANLLEFGEIRQDNLAADFAGRFTPSRGYGPSMVGQLLSVRQGMHWFDAASNQFEGQGSYGNGAAMRIAPLGAYFADDLALCIEQARLASEVTHYHPEGIAGGIAIAVAAAQAARFAEEGRRPSRSEFIEAVLPYIPDSEVKAWSRAAQNLEEGGALQLAASVLGTGIRVSAQDTVPFCLWSAGEQLSHYEEALWLTVAGLGGLFSRVV